MTKLRVAGSIEMETEFSLSMLNWYSMDGAYVVDDICNMHSDRSLVISVPKHNFSRPMSFISNLMARSFLSWGISGGFLAAMSSSST